MSKNKACEFCNKNKVFRKLKCNHCLHEHYTCSDCKLAFLNNYLESYENEFNVDCTEQLSEGTINFYKRKIKELTRLTKNLSGKYKNRNKYYKTCMECIEGIWMPRDLEFSYDNVVSLEQQERYNFLHLK